MNSGLPFAAIQLFDPFAANAGFFAKLCGHAFRCVRRLLLIFRGLLFKISDCVAGRDDLHDGNIMAQLLSRRSDSVVKSKIIQNDLAKIPG